MIMKNTNRGDLDNWKRLSVCKNTGSSFKGLHRGFRYLEGGLCLRILFFFFFFQWHAI